MNGEGKQKIRIFTRQFEIIGDLNIYPGVRLTDFMNESKEFISVTEAQVRRQSDTVIMKAKFLNVRKNEIELILPEEMVDATDL